MIGVTDDIQNPVNRTNRRPTVVASLWLSSQCLLLLFASERLTPCGHRAALFVQSGLASAVCRPGSTGVSLDGRPGRPGRGAQQTWTDPQASRLSDPPEWVVVQCRRLVDHPDGPGEMGAVHHQRRERSGWYAGQGQSSGVQHRRVVVERHRPLGRPDERDPAGFPSSVQHSRVDAPSVGMRTLVCPAPAGERCGAGGRHQVQVPGRGGVQPGQPGAHASLSGRGGSQSSRICWVTSRNPRRSSSSVGRPQYQ